MKHRTMALARQGKTKTKPARHFSNQDYKQVFSDLNHKKTELESLNRDIIRGLDIRLSVFQKIALAVSDKLPILKRFVDNDVAEPLSEIENSLRDFINLTQDSLVALHEIAQAKHDEIMELRTDLERAISEKWTVEQLRTYIIEKSDIELDPRVADLMKLELDTIDEERYQRKREDLLGTLAANAASGEELLKLLVTVVYNSLGIFEGALTQYYAYVNIAEPMKVIKEAAENLTQGTNAMYTAKDAVVSILEASVKAIGAATRASKLAEKYRLNSPDVTAALAEANFQLQQTMDNHARPAIGGNTKPIACLPPASEVIEAEAMVDSSS